MYNLNSTSVFNPATISSCLGECAPGQIINLNMAFNSLDSLVIKDNCGNEYDINSLMFAYSVDNLCWSCYMTYNDMIANTLDIGSDFYIRIKVKGVIGSISINNEVFKDYSTSLAQGFEFSYCSNNVSSNLYSPYTNMDCAIGLQQQMVENIACMFGIPIYYFKLAPVESSADITFKEYTLMNVESVKQIKMIVTDNQLPSSKPTFNEWGLDWESDWETEISKGMFATAFGPNAQPLEGDLIYIPMMKRMWMVNGAYEEKKDAFMWNSTTFKVALVKYQAKDSVDLGDTEALVNSFVKNKYEDLFGDQENLASNESTLDAPSYTPESLYSVADSDACRKYITTDTIEFSNKTLYYKGTLIADDRYVMNHTKGGKIVYQKKYCGDSGVISFIITPYPAKYEGTLVKASNLEILINQSKETTTLKLMNNTKCSLELSNNKTYFAFFRWSKRMNLCEAFAAEYTHPEMPEYKLQSYHYLFDIDNGMSVTAKYNVEMIQNKEGNVEINCFSGDITNIKVIDIYIDNISQILQMLPNNQHLLINDTARKLINGTGVLVR